MLSLIDNMQNVYTKITKCSTCFNMDCSSPCYLCKDKKRDQSKICIVEDLTDLWAIEKSGVYNGLYHILGGALSVIDGITPKELNIPKLLKRIKNFPVKEIIMATNSTVEGQTTCQYITKMIKDNDILISFLAHGMPIGSEMDYLDEGTLNIAFAHRKSAKI